MKVKKVIKLMKSNLRAEVDAFGSIEIPIDKYWGAQTQRAIINFALAGSSTNFNNSSLGLVKKACAMSNEESGKLDSNKQMQLFRQQVRLLMENLMIIFLW